MQRLHRLASHLWGWVRFPLTTVPCWQVLLGEAGVGKSSLVLRFVANHFKAYSESTIGAAFMSKTLVVDDQAIKFQIWDTAGQEKYHSLAPMYYRGASAAIVVFDITKTVRRSLCSAHA